MAVLIAAVAHIPGAVVDVAGAVISGLILFSAFWIAFVALHRRASKANRRSPLRPRIAMVWAMVPWSILVVMGTVSTDPGTPTALTHAAEAAAAAAALPVDPAFYGTLSATVAMAMGTAMQGVVTGLLAGGIALLVGRFRSRKELGSRKASHLGSAAIGLASGVLYLAAVFGLILAAFG